jgi:uncharacterized protein (DUF58 family)
MWKRLVNKSVNPLSSGIDITLEELIALRNKVIHSPIHIKKSCELFSGQNMAKIRGRGIEFAATREYQPGDDIRRMAWRVTARSLKPHVKVYHEERERPVWLAVDLSPSMYFGTRCRFKSVSSIKQAAFLGWSHLHKRERIGALIASPHNMLVYRPEAREREFLSILKSLSACSTIQPAFTEKNCLNHLLVTIQQQVRPGNLLFILSDFLEFDARNKKLILHFAQRVQVKLIFVYDPFEAEPPPAYQYVLTDGQKTALFNTENTQARDHYQQQFQQKFHELRDFSRKNNLILEVLRTDQEQKVFTEL